jgi:hypothetical protein
MIERSPEVPVVRLLAGLLLAALGAASFAASPNRPVSNRSADPDADYGRCHESGSAIGKWTLVGTAGETAEACLRFRCSSAGNDRRRQRQVACDSLTRAACPATGPLLQRRRRQHRHRRVAPQCRDRRLGKYTGCPKNQTPQSGLARAAGVDRGASAASSLGCGSAGAPSRCPCAWPAHRAAPVPRCIGTRTARQRRHPGIVGSNGPGDPTHAAVQRHRHQPGFFYKADELREAVSR